LLTIVSDLLKLMQHSFFIFKTSFRTDEGLHQAVCILDFPQVFQSTLFSSNFPPSCFLTTSYDLCINYGLHQRDKYLSLKFVSFRSIVNEMKECNTCADNTARKCTHSVAFHDYSTEADIFSSTVYVTMPCFVLAE